MMIFSSSYACHAVNRRAPLPKFNQAFTAGPTAPTPRSPTVSTSFSPTPIPSRPTTARSTQSTKSQRRRSPPSLYFPADFCGPPKKPKPMPKLPRKGSAMADSPSFPTNVSHSEAPLLHITHNRSQSNFSSLMSDGTENEIQDLNRFPISSQQYNFTQLHPQPDLLPPSSDSVVPRSPTPESEDEASASMLGLFSVAQLRRRKMDKITRTLGEAVPAELVFPALTQAEVLMEFRPQPEAVPRGKGWDKEKEREKIRKAGRRSSISVSTLSSFASLSSLTNFTAGRRPSTSSGETPLTIKTSQCKRPKKTANVSQRSSMSSSTVPSPLVFANSSESFRPAPPPSQRPAADEQDQASRTQATPNIFTVRPEEHLRDYFGAHIRSSSPFFDAVVPAQPLHLPSSDDYGQWEAGLSDEEGVGKSVTRTRTEKTQGWMGEWNRDDMGHVMKKLRALK